MGALIEPSRGLIELYFKASVMNETINRLEADGAATVRVDAGRWTDDQMLTDLAEALSFPAYFGKNLDALADCLFDVVSGEYGFDPDSSMRILSIYQFEAYARNAPEQSSALLEILHDTAILALKLGRPFLVLLQSDDPDLRLPTVGATAIGWNRAEFQRTKRS